MSTTINVTVDDGGLPAKNRQQTAANRQAFVQGQASQQAAQQGVDQRAADRKAAGLDPTTGRPTGSSSRLPRVTQEPAANRRGGNEFFLMRPSAPPTGGQVQLINRGLISFASVPGGTLTYSSVLGPNSSPTLICDSSPRGNYVNITGRFPFEGSTSRFKEGVKDFTLQFYVKFGTTFTELSDWVDATISLGSSGRIDIALGLFNQNSDVGRQAWRTLDFRVREDSTKSSSVLFDQSTLLSSTSGPQLLPGVWHHAAITKSQNTLRAFFDGQMIGSTSVSWTTLLFSSGFSSTWLDANFGTSQTVVTPAQPVYLHGLRFDTKALYTANFTPPPSL